LFFDGGTEMSSEMKNAVTSDVSGSTKLTVTPKAILEIKRLLQAEPANLQSILRVNVVGGGCSGMSYKLEFESKPPAEKDLLFEQDGVKVVVDPKALLFIAGTELDFSDGLSGTGFLFKNPNAKRTCGCGTSFSA
jgi:iron-sulfur cluster assembly protein